MPECTIHDLPVRRTIVYLQFHGFTAVKSVDSDHTLTIMRAYLICLLLSAFPAWAHAAIVQLQVRPGIHASAEYLDGQRDKPAILLLHGFLQTRDFPTVATLARGLRDAGYPVLSPTLSLNIPNRSQSLACEAVHRHSMDDDIGEITRWVNWLKSRGHRSIVLIGHSFGSLQLLAYLDAKPDRAVKGYFGASLIETRIGKTPRAPLIDAAERSGTAWAKSTGQPADFLLQEIPGHAR